MFVCVADGCVGQGAGAAEQQPRGQHPAVVFRAATELDCVCVATVMRVVVVANVNCMLR